MRKADILNVDCLNVGGGEVRGDSVPQDPELPSTTLVVGDDHLADDLDGVLGGQGDVSSVPALDAPDGDPSAHVGDAVLVHEEIIDPCKPRRTSPTNCEEVE